MPITNWTKFFQDEHDVYVQNIANAQVSIEFEVAPGVSQGYLFPHSRNPVNLTQHIPFHAIRNSVNFRKMLNRRPSVLQLLSEEEYLKYYEQKRNSWGLKSVDDAIDRAEETRQGIASHTAKTTDKEAEPIHKVVSDDSHLGGRKEVAPIDGIINSDEVIHPRVLHLCQQVSVMLDDKDKMKASELLEELEQLEGQLKIDDYEYIRAHGWWKTVKKWSQKKVAELIATSEEGDG